MFKVHLHLPHKHEIGHGFLNTDTKRLERIFVTSPSAESSIKEMNNGLSRMTALGEERQRLWICVMCAYLLRSVIE